MKGSVKKLNAWLSLTACILLFLHIIYITVSYIMFHYDPLIIRVTGILFGIIVGVHVLLSAISVFGSHETISLRYYPLMNIRTIIQRIGGIIILVLLPIHTRTAGWISGHRIEEGEFTALIVVEIIFWAVVLLHVGASVTRAFVSLGYLETERAMKRLDWLIWIVCAVLFILVVCVIIRTQFAVFHMKA